MNKEKQLTDKELLSEIFTLMETNPGNWKDKLSDRAKLLLREQVREKRVKDTLKIMKCLNAEKINYIILKGISLWYFDRGRDFEDIDILVAPEDVEKVADILNQKFGYQYKRPKELDFLRNPKQNNAHDVSIVTPKMTPVEIHYRMFNYLDQHKLSLMSDKLFLEFDGTEIPCHSKELQLLEAVLHHVYNDFFICDRKKWVNDINLIINNYDIDWKKFIRMAEELRQKEVIYLTMKMLGHVAMPPQILIQLEPVSWRSYLKKHVFIWAGYFVWDRLFPPKDILYQRFHIKPGSIFFPLSYPANWIRLFFVILAMIFKRILP